MNEVILAGAVTAPPEILTVNIGNVPTPKLVVSLSAKLILPNGQETEWTHTVEKLPRRNEADAKSYIDNLAEQFIPGDLYLVRGSLSVRAHNNNTYSNVRYEEHRRMNPNHCDVERRDDGKFYATSTIINQMTAIGVIGRNPTPPSDENQPMVFPLNIPQAFGSGEDVVKIKIWEEHLQTPFSGAQTGMQALVQGFLLNEVGIDDNGKEYGGPYISAFNPVLI